MTGSTEAATTINVNTFQATNKPKVHDTVSVSKILATIKYGDKNLPLIQNSRKHGKGSEEYVKIKTFYLPTVRFNFLFDGYAKNENIIASTGLIYLDADNVDTIPNSEYIFAKWKSLSGLGYGILVRVEGLTKDNHHETYNSLASLIDIDADAGGRKATQQTVLSYDPDLYYNENSKVYVCKKVSLTNINKERKGIRANDTFLDEGKIRFHNIGDFFEDDTPYIVFKDKVCVCTPYIPRVIPEGKRNGMMFYILCQYAILNPLQEAFLYGIAEQINRHMKPNLSKYEVAQIVRNVIAARKNKTLKDCCTHYRKILFNPLQTFSFQQKMEIVGSILGTERSQKTLDLIYEALENWDFEANGKITQVKVAKMVGRGEATVKRHWYNFKDFAEYLSK